MTEREAARRALGMEDAPVSAAASCPHCGRPVVLVAGDVQPAPPQGAEPAGALGRPRPIFRGAGAQRERIWGAVTDAPASVGDELTIVARNGKTWSATVAEVMEPHHAGHLVAWWATAIGNPTRKRPAAPEIPTGWPTIAATWRPAGIRHRENGPNPPDRRPRRADRYQNRA